MKYSTGEILEPGDWVEIDGDATCIILHDLDRRVSIEGASIDKWLYLERGIVVMSGEYGLMHYPDQINDMQLIKKGACKR